MLRGRDWFSFLKLILLSLSFGLKLVPRSLLEWFWILADLLPGKVGVGARYILAKRLAKHVGDNVFFGRCVEVKSWHNLSLGSNVSIHKNCYIDASGGLVIGSDVSIAHGSSLLSFDHTWSDVSLPIRSNPLIFRNILIEDDVWIGCGVRVLSGVKVGSRSVIAAGAVVNLDVRPKCLVGGVPAKVIKEI